MDVYIKYLDGKVEHIEGVEDVKWNSQMRSIEVTYKERERLIANGETVLYEDKTYRNKKILNFAAIESIAIVEEE